MTFKLKLLHGFLRKHGRIFVYGCGEYGEMFYDICMKLKCVNKIKAYVVSGKSKKNASFFHELPIITIGDMNINWVEQFVFVAVGGKLRYEIEKILIQKGVMHIACIEDYVYGIYKGKDIEEYCRGIVDWYVESHIDQLTNYEKITRDVMELFHKKQEKEPKKMAFVLCNARAREVRLITALRKKGYATCIYLFGKNKAYVAEKEFEEAGIELRKWMCKEELFYYLLLESAETILVDEVSTRSDDAVSVELLWMREYLGKIIYAPYDIRHGSYPSLTLLSYSNERCALENADGVIFRYLNQKKYLKEKFNFILKKPSIEFLDYCDAIYEDEKRKESRKLRLCWVLSHTHDVLPRIIENEQYMHSASLQQILPLLDKHSDCSLDIYTWSATKEQIQLLDLLKRKYKNFNYYIRIDHIDLINRLKNYDYGMDLCSGRNIPEWPDSICGYCENAMLNSSSNKFFDYISAGIPIIASWSVNFCDLLEHFGILVNMTVEEFDVDFLRMNKEMYKRNVFDKQKEFLIEKHIERLVDFLEKVSESASRGIS